MSKKSWSVSQMRKQRWEAIGAPADKKPKDEDIISGELDEDFSPALTQDPTAQIKEGNIEGYSGPLHEGPDFGDEDAQPRGEAAIYSEQESEQCDFVRPFENLGELPDDLSDAFESFKLAILAHKRKEWKEVPLQDLIDTLEAFKALATAPSDD